MKKASEYFQLLVLSQVVLFFVGLGFTGTPRRSASHARTLAAFADVNGSLKTTMEMFRADCGRLPTTVEGWNVLIEAPKDGSLTNWHGPYLDQPFAPEDPWGHPYVYRFPGLHSTNGYDLYSIGPDGISKTGGNDLDDISNWDKPASGTNNGERLFRDVDELLLVIPVLFGFRVVAGITSGEFRAVVLENRAADRLWFVMSILALLIVLLLPRISG